jgi:prepilin-type processing-associated H-X9-DG protein
VGETDRFLDYGGAVNLLLVDGHMGFEVNLEAVKRCGVEISSTLLRFGQIRRKRGT